MLKDPKFMLFAYLTLVTVVPTLFTLIYHLYKAQLEAKLKEQMIQQGMSAEEIVMVLKATKK